MPEGKKAYYQVSFTGGQALAAVVVMIGALGLAFFFGTKAGFERSGDVEPAARPATGPAPAPAPTAASVTTSETPAASGSEASTAPEEAPVFEDREAGVTEAAGPAPPGRSEAPSRTEIAAPAPSKTSGGVAASRSEPAAPTHPTAAAASPAPAKEKASESAKAAAGKGGFFVQIVSTSSKSEANRWKEKLAAKKFHTAAVSSVESKKGTLWRVRVGPYPDREQAKKAAAKITAEFRQKAWVAPE